MKTENQKLFERAIKAMKKADVVQVEIEFKRIQFAYEWSFNFSNQLDSKQTKALEKILTDYAVSVFESDAYYNPILSKRANYGAIASFVMNTGKPKVDVNFRLIKVDVLTQGYLEYKEQS